MSRLEYREIQSSEHIVFKEKNSKFITYAYTVYSEQEVQSCLATLKKKYNDARHFCYAYVLGKQYDGVKYSDDGEPSGTAGIPIYQQIQSFDLTNVLIVVVRYFGGVKLGVGGLRQAYKQATQEVLHQASLVTKYVQETLKLSVPIELIRHYYQIQGKCRIEVVEEHMEAHQIRATWKVAKGDVSQCIHWLAGASHRIQVHQE